MSKEKLLSIITKEVVTAAEQTSAEELAELMRKYDIGVVVIVEGKKVVGIVSERDIVQRIVAPKLSSLTPAKEFMTTEVVMVDLKEGLNKIYETLATITFRHLPIVEHGELIGITSRSDLLDVLSADFK